MKEFILHLQIMEIQKTPIEGLKLLRPKIFRDGRGWFTESYNRDQFFAAGVADTFIQDNHSSSIRHTLRGLHFQSAPGQVKLVRCTKGEVWDVAVDVRGGSPTFGQHFGVRLNAEESWQFYIPVGFAHGFLVLSESAEIQYKCSNLYNAATETGIQWDDADLAVAWPLAGIAPIISERDKHNQSFREYQAKLAAAK